MISMFSQIIFERFKHEAGVSTCNDLTEALSYLKENANYTLHQVLFCHSITTLDYIAEQHDTWFNVYHIKELHDLADWISKNIIYEIPTMSLTTTRIKVRIAIGMLNKIENSGIISKELSLFYFDNIVTNCLDLWHLSYIPFYGDEVENLPF